MIGFGSELETFVFELTYNYGIHQYEKGNDLRYIKLSVDDSWSPPQNLPVSESNGRYIVSGPDNIEWHLTRGQSTRYIELVSLNVADLSASKKFYENAATLTLVGETKDSATFAWRTTDLTKLEMVQLEGESRVAHGTAFGRIAFTCPDVSQVELRMKESHATIKHGPVKLDTPGKATVEVIIVEDVDGYEICFVEVTGFDELSKPSQGADKIDWDTRKDYGADTR